MSAVVELQRVSKHYPGGVHALDDVSLSIEPAETVSIIGPSGSGKSSMLHLMGTIDDPTSGTVRFEGNTVAELTDKQVSALRATRIGFVFQQFHLPLGVPILDAVADGLLYAGVPRRQRRDRAGAALESVGLGRRAHHRPTELSGGERQRAAIARAIVRSPTLLLADEPTGNLDSASGERVLELLRGFQARGTAVVVITHDAEVASAMSRQVTIRDGHLSS